MAALASDHTTEAWSIALWKTGDKSIFLAMLHEATVDDAIYWGRSLLYLASPTCFNPATGEVGAIALLQEMPTAVIALWHNDAHIGIAAALGSKKEGL